MEAPSILAALEGVEHMVLVRRPSQIAERQGDGEKRSKANKVRNKLVPSHEIPPCPDAEERAIR